MLSVCVFVIVKVIYVGSLSLVTEKERKKLKHFHFSVYVEG